MWGNKGVFSVQILPIPRGTGSCEGSWRGKPTSHFSSKLHFGRTLTVHSLWPLQSWQLNAPSHGKIVHKQFMLSRLVSEFPENTPIHSLPLTSTKCISYEVGETGARTALGGPVGHEATASP
jgi:hypothetical protein